MIAEVKNNIFRLSIPVMMGAALACVPAVSFSQHKDTSVITLEKVEIQDRRNPPGFKTSIPVQTLNNQLLTRLNILSAGDAARYFSGVLVKDYGGVGGLKTISVRSLGAANTGVIYDGIPVTDIQTGQIDLSRFPTFLVQSINLFQANPTEILAPARSFALPSVLAINTDTYKPVNFSKSKWQVGASACSFGLWQPHAAAYLPVGKQTIISMQSGATFSKGDYPYLVNNGNLSEKRRRTNSKTQSVQTEANLVKQFTDSSLLQVKLLAYNSSRELPGSVIFFNARSAQQLRNHDVFVQSRYQKKISEKTALLVSAKYSHTYTRYTDPDFQNGNNGLDDRYKQNEYYLSAALSKHVTQRLTVAVASDVAWNKLSANTNNFAGPTRFGTWSSLALRYTSHRFELSGSILNTYFSDKTKRSATKLTHDKITSTASVSFRPALNSPFLIRLFFKEAYRMPTFNDLYYNFIGNRNLNPETSRQYNLGLTWSKTTVGKISRINVSADVYYNRVKDKIVAAPNQNLFNWTMFNLGKVGITGLDLNAETNVNFNANARWFSRVAYTFQHALDITNPASAGYKNRIPYTPDHSGSVVSIFSYKSWSVSYSLLFSGERFTLGANAPANRLNGWATHDLSVVRTLRFFSFETDLKIGVNNVFDNRYDVVRYFPMPERNLMFSITFKNL